MDKQAKHNSADNPSLLRRVNIRRVLDIFREKGPISRIEISRVTGMSAPTVSKLMRVLDKAHLVEVLGTNYETDGRPSIIYKLASKKSRVIGVVIDIRQCSITTAGFDGDTSVAQPVIFDTPATYELLMKQLIAGIRKFINDKPSVNWLGIGLSLPGLINSRTGEIAFSPNLHFTDGHFPAKDLREATGIETTAVQEERGLCFAERMFGTDRSIDNFVVVDIASGFGMGIFIDGNFLVGHSGFAGEIGHMTLDPAGLRCGCGNRGCLETVATDAALVALVAKRLNRKLNIEQIVGLAQSGAINVALELKDILEHLATGLSAVINILNPQALFIHGRLFDIEAGAFDRLTELVRSRSLKPSMADCKLVRAHGSKTLGSVAIILEHLYSTIGPRVSR